jgi:hypothetical protein
VEPAVKREKPEFTDDDSPDGPEPPRGEVADLRPPGHWGRHPLARVVLFAALGVGLVGRFLVDGDGRMLLVCAAMAVLMPLSIAGGLGQMRGTVSPLPGHNWRLVSPIAIIVWSTGFLILTIILPLDIWLTRGDRSPWLNGSGLVAGALIVAGVMIQIGSLSDQWPDKWRPPYARQQPADAPEADPGDGPADRTPDQA